MEDVRTMTVACALGYFGVFVPHSGRPFTEQLVFSVFWYLEGRPEAYIQVFPVLRGRGSVYVCSFLAFCLSPLIYDML